MFSCFQGKNAKLLWLGLVVLSFWLVASFFKARQVVAPGYGLKPEPEAGFTRRNCLADECLLVEGLIYPVGDLPPEINQALLSALDDEYRSLATYQSIQIKLGPVSPFVMVAGAEEQHLALLQSLFDKYGLPVPSNPWSGKFMFGSDLVSACRIGVEAEVSNAALYEEKLLPVVEEYEDLTLVFTDLMTASRQRHLPAFEKCAGSSF